VFLWLAGKPAAGAVRENGRYGQKTEQKTGKSPCDEAVEQWACLETHIRAPLRGAAPGRIGGADGTSGLWYLSTIPKHQ